MSAWNNFCTMMFLVLTIILPVVLGEAQGPEPMTRRKRWTNSFDCPDSWKSRPRPPELPGSICPPGQSRPYPYPHPPRPWPSYPPCDPWVDAEGDCHMSDRVFDGEACRSTYGEEIYAQFQDNARRLPPVSPPGTPAPPCIPDSSGHY